MFECEHCGTDVERVRRHREYGVATTHRVTRWLCRACHPAAPESVAPAERSPERVVTDGGRVGGACPDCASRTVDVHGIQNCPVCLWTDR